MFEKKILATMKPVVDAQDKTNKITMGIAATGCVLGLAGCSMITRVAAVESDIEDMKDGIGSVNKNVNGLKKVVSKQAKSVQKQIIAVNKKADKAIDASKKAKRVAEYVQHNMERRNNFGSILHTPASTSLAGFDAMEMPDESPFPTVIDGGDDDDFPEFSKMESNIAPFMYDEDDADVYDEEDDEDEEIEMNPLSKLDE